MDGVQKSDVEAAFQSYPRGGRPRLRIEVSLRYHKVLHVPALEM